MPPLAIAGASDGPTPNASQEHPLMSDSTSSQVAEHEEACTERRTWESVAQDVIMQLARAIPYALLVWQANVRH